jgi:hypothetical protein
LLWLAVIKSGLTEPVFTKAGLAVKKEVYICKCLPVLYKLIQKHNKNDNIMFWPDLTSAPLRKGYVGTIRRTKN